MLEIEQPIPLNSERKGENQGEWEGLTTTVKLSRLQDRRVQNSRLDVKGHLTELLPIPSTRK